jgi:hypothetical protein
MAEISGKKILFITLVAINDINDRNLYADLMRFFIYKGHHVTIISPVERRNKAINLQIINENYSILRVKTPNIQKANVVEKTISTFLIDCIIKNAIKSKFKNKKIDWIIYSTPPITLVKTIEYIKAKFNAKSFLMLKDIFPQNAVDLNMIANNSIIHKYFRSIEKKLYSLSDRIGCMSAANKDYLISNNKEVSSDKVVVCPNSIEIDNSYKTDFILPPDIKIENRENKKVFIYGGNIGKPQGIDFLISILGYFKNNENIFFIIIGSGTEYYKILSWYNTFKPDNVLIQPFLPKEMYTSYLSLSDVGLILLDHRFTIPNYPSRLLDYLEYHKPVLCMTDKNTDIGKDAVKNGYGWSCVSNNLIETVNTIQKIINMDIDELRNMGNLGFNYLTKNFTLEQSYNAICD